MAINLNNLLNYATPERAYAGKLENLGLITAPDLEKELHTLLAEDIVIYS